MEKDPSGLTEAKGVIAEAQTVILSHARQLNFSRTVWITFHCRGITSSVSVTSSPS
jgi:hypothetical protein